MTVTNKAMSSFRWFADTPRVTVPFNARYLFPTQANAAKKFTPRISPKNGADFKPGSTIRIDFPAQGYINPIHTTLQFDVELTCDFNGLTDAAVIFQNNIQSLFSRVQLMYSGNTIQDVPMYNVVMRAVTEWTSESHTGSLDHNSITDGIGGVVTHMRGTTYAGLAGVRGSFIQGLAGPTVVVAAPAFGVTGPSPGDVPNSTTAGTVRTCTRRYQIKIGDGIFLQDKLIPAKYMSSQLYVNISLAPAAEAIMVKQIAGNITLPSTFAPTYTLKNVIMLPEILEFDAAYDEGFLVGLQTDGIPIRFTTWHTYSFNITNQSAARLSISERSRSIKALFAVQRETSTSYKTDSGAFLYDTSTVVASGGVATSQNTMQSFQWRLGGKYYPSAPVQLVTEVGGGVPNGGVEAFIELQKALNVLGDPGARSAVNPMRWAIQPDANNVWPQFDYRDALFGWDPPGHPKYLIVNNAANGWYGNVGSACFGMAVNLETSSGAEIAGLNGMEQSDIELNIKWKGPQGQNGSREVGIDVFALVDAMIVLKTNNNVELVE